MRRRRQQQDVIGAIAEQFPQSKKVLVNRFELMRQRIDAGNGETKIGIELVSNAKRVGLQGKTQQASIAIIGEAGIGDGQASEIRPLQREPAKLFRT